MGTETNKQHVEIKMNCVFLSRVLDVAPFYQDPYWQASGQLNIDTWDRERAQDLPLHVGPATSGIWGERKQCEMEGMQLANVRAYSLRYYLYARTPETIELLFYTTYWTVFFRVNKDTVSTFQEFIA